MSIKAYLSDFWDKAGDHIVVFCSVLLAIGIAFLSGRLSASESGKLPINIRASVSEDVGVENFQPLHADNQTTEPHQPKYGLYVASKNSKIYHKWDCPSVSRINNENKLWFDTVKEAEESGRALASDCTISPPNGGSPPLEGGD